MSSQFSTVFITALPIEARILAPQSKKILTYYPIATDCAIYAGGIGAEAAKAAARAAIEQGAKRVVSFGTAGGLSVEYKAGTLILPRQVLTQAGERCDFHSALDFWPLIKQLPYTQRALLTVNQILHNSDQKAASFAKTNAVAVDMESFYIAKMASAAGIEFTVIRAIADPADFTLPPLDGLLTANGEIIIPRLMRQFLGHPLQILAFIRMGRYFAAAQKSLKRFVQKL